MTTERDDVVVIAFKRLAEGGYVALDSANNPIKAFSTYHELEVDTIMGMRRVCGDHPSQGKPRFMSEPEQPVRDELTTQPAKAPFRERALNLVSRATR